MSENEKMNIDHQVAVLALVNLGAEAVNKFFTWFAPVLSPMLTLAQIVVATVTIVWVWQRVKGARLDNKLKQKELDKK
jgi:hypothetical protein